MANAINGEVEESEGQGTASDEVEEGTVKPQNLLTLSEEQIKCIFDDN